MEDRCNRCLKKLKVWVYTFGEGSNFCKSCFQKEKVKRGNEK